MVPWYIWICSASLAVSVPLMWHAVAGGRVGRKARDALSVATTNDFRGVSLARPARERLADGVLAPIGRVVARLTPTGVAREAGRRISRAGLSHRLTAERLLAMKALTALAVFMAFFLFAIVGGSAVTLGLGLGLAAVAFVAPDSVLIRKGDAREETMRNDLPDVIDQVVIAVEAGLSFDSAVDRVARRGSGPMEQEMARVTQDIALGMSRKDSLMALGDRTDIPELRELVLALAQSEEHGLPLGRVLRIQADEIRDKRRSRAEERAMKIPVKIVFPVVMCILPCIAAVIVGPAIVRISENVNLGG
jgi:tight adherence protein C